MESLLILFIARHFFNFSFSTLANLIVYTLDIRRLKDNLDEN